MTFWNTVGRIGEKVSDVAGDIGMGMAGAGAVVAATGIGLPLAGLLEAGAALSGSISMGAKGASFLGDTLGNK